MEQKITQSTPIKAKFLSNIDTYRDHSSWLNFTDNFKKLSFASKFRVARKLALEEMKKVETKYLQELVENLSDVEVEEWMSAADDCVKKEEQRLLEKHLWGEPPYYNLFSL
jgi:hypothetical protein